MSDTSEAIDRIREQARGLDLIASWLEVNGERLPSLPRLDMYGEALRVEVQAFEPDEFITAARVLAETGTVTMPTDRLTGYTYAARDFGGVELNVWIPDSRFMVRVDPPTLVDILAEPEPIPFLPIDRSPSSAASLVTDAAVAEVAAVSDHFERIEQVARWLNVDDTAFNILSTDAHGITVVWVDGRGMTDIPWSVLDLPETYRPPSSAASDLPKDAA